MSRPSTHLDVTFHVWSKSFPDRLQLTALATLKVKPIDAYLVSVALTVKAEDGVLSHYVLEARETSVEAAYQIWARCCFCKGVKKRPL